jgi:hypothetical protein
LKLKEFLSVFPEQFEMFCPTEGKVHTAVRIFGSTHLPRQHIETTSSTVSAMEESLGLSPNLHELDTPATTTATPTQSTPTSRPTPTPTPTTQTPPTPTISGSSSAAQGFTLSSNGVHAAAPSFPSSPKSPQPRLSSSANVCSSLLLAAPR